MCLTMFELTGNSRFERYRFFSSAQMEEKKEVEKKTRIKSTWPSFSCIFFFSSADGDWWAAVIWEYYWRTVRMRDRSGAQRKNSFNLFAAVKYLPRVCRYDVDFFAIAFLLFFRFVCVTATWLLSFTPFSGTRLPACSPVRPDTIVRIVSSLSEKINAPIPLHLRTSPRWFAPFSIHIGGTSIFARLCVTTFSLGLFRFTYTVSQYIASHGKCWIISYLHREYLHVSTPFTASETHSKFSLIPTQ